MKELISKELLSEVSGQECICVKVDELTGKTVYQYITTVERIPWNIYELAHNCKEWAYKNNFIVITLPYFSGKWSWKLHGDEISDDIDYYSEPEAIFKACQWILDNKDAR